MIVEDASLPTTEEAATHYHNGRTKRPPVRDRMVIAWDLEGITYENGKPQAPVLFGSSAAAPLIVEQEGDELNSPEIINHIFEVAERFPHAIHVGYGFGSYDCNQLLKDFPAGSLRQIWDINKVRVIIGDQRISIQWIPRKKIVLTRRPVDAPIYSKGRVHNGAGVSVTIYDFASFFQKPFLPVAESLLSQALSTEERQIIESGKAHRGYNTWQDMPEIINYWQCEIQLMRRTFEKFRAIMVQAGYELKDWHGPGALAAYILRTRGLYPHLKGCQITDTGGFMPLEVHEASKRAFAGGRFEPFQFGLIDYITHVIDLNSAYPFAICELPSFAKDAGEWVYIKEPKQIEHFGIYHIAYHMPNAKKTEHRPGPLFFRNPDGMISYPQSVAGWYMSPEARVAIDMTGATVIEGWIWKERDPTNRPWSFVQELYDTRQRLGKDNLLSLPFKLGPNSLYGKLAQIAGWDRKKRLPPKSHALPIAAWVTSRTREMLLKVMYQLEHDDLISVDTDSLTIKRLPPGLDYGKGLGQWGHDIYEAFMLVQSGLYLAKRDGEWHIKSRGLDRDDIKPEGILAWLKTLKPSESWRPLRLMGRPRFVTLGAALRRGLEIWRIWETREVEISPSGKGGKRAHYTDSCPACWKGKGPAESAHWLAINETQMALSLMMESQPRILPWEQKQPDMVKVLREQQAIDQEGNHGD
jgi:hypothetical protein